MAVLARVGLAQWATERGGLGAPVGERGALVSGGQAQRIALARAIVHRPRLLVGDEPLSALDVTVRAQVLELLRELRRTQGFTLVMVSHDIGVVQNLCDEVIVMKDGRIVEEGPTEKVLLAPQVAYTRRLLASIPVIEPGRDPSAG